MLTLLWPVKDRLPFWGFGLAAYYDSQLEQRRPGSTFINNREYDFQHQRFPSFQGLIIHTPRKFDSAD